MADASGSIGDRLVINQGVGGLAFELPLTVTEAKATGWVRGSCFAGMGSHWFKDLTGGHMTWTAANLLPVVLMFDEESANPTNARRQPGWGGIPNGRAMVTSAARPQVHLCMCPQSAR